MARGMAREEDWGWSGWSSLEYGECDDWPCAHCGRLLRYDEVELCDHCMLDINAGFIDEMRLELIGRGLSVSAMESPWLPSSTSGLGGCTGIVLAIPRLLNPVDFWIVPEGKNIRGRARGTGGVLVAQSFKTHVSLCHGIQAMRDLVRRVLDERMSRFVVTCSTLSLSEEEAVRKKVVDVSDITLLDKVLGSLD